jgi:hypothetical protein
MYGILVEARLQTWWSPSFFEQTALGSVRERVDRIAIQIEPTRVRTVLPYRIV